MIADHAPLEARTDVQGSADLVMGLTAPRAGGHRRRDHRRARLPEPRRGHRRRWRSWSSSRPSVRGDWHSCPRDSACRRRRHRRHRLLLVHRGRRGARRHDAVRRPVRADRGRHGRRSPGRVPAAARRPPRLPAARHQLPRQPLGAALAGRPPGARAVRRRRARATRWHPGDVVVPDQLVDRTHRRISSYVETGAVHLPFADPYCPGVSAALAACRRRHQAGGTMVVIEGPRFSTRAESAHYADQGWTLINMTGMPEASLARELRMCYASIALVTDMDAGAESGERCRSGGGLRAVPAEPRAADRPAHDGHRAACRTPTAAPAPPGPTASTSPTTSRTRGLVKVLLTGSAGFIGGAIGRALDDVGRRGRPRRPDARQGPRRGRRAPRAPTRSTCGTPTPGRDLLHGVDAVCHQAAVVGAGVTVADLPAYASHNDLGTAALLATMHEVGVDRLVLASSMVVYGEGRYACAEHGDQVPRPACDRCPRRR